MKNHNNVNFKLINILVIIAIVCLLYLIRGLWIGIVTKIFAIIWPFLVAFAIAYALYPIEKKLLKSGFPKWLAIGIIFFVILGLIAICLVLIVPILYEQTLLFLSNISAFLSDITTKYEVDFGDLQETLSDFTSGIIKVVGDSISSGAISVVNASVSAVTSFIIILFSSIYMLIDMEKIREFIKNSLNKTNKRIYNYVLCLDNEITSYFGGLGKIIIIQFFEYLIAFGLIGHPNYLILAILAAITTIIPYFGGLIINIIAILVASVVSTRLLLLTIIVCIICPQIDGYIIGPKVYGKTNQLHPLVIIFAVFAGGILGGFWGIVVSTPVAIILIATYKYFKEDINKKINKMRSK